MNIEDIPAQVLDKIQELAFKEYGVVTVAELKDATVTAEFERIINSYLSEASKRILRAKVDEAKAHQPTDSELIEKLQDRLDASPSIEE